MLGGEPQPAGGAVDDLLGLVDDRVVERARGAATARFEPLDAGPDQDSVETSRLAPSSKDVISSLGRSGGEC